MHKRQHGRVRAQGVAGHLRVGATFTPGASVDNLSLGGAFVRSLDVLPVGTAVVVDLVRPGLKKALRLSGRVVSALTPAESRARHSPPGMGIQFDPHPIDVVERLGELLKAIAPGGKVLDGDRPAVPELPPPTSAASPKEGIAVPESARLMVQVTGLLMEPGDTQTRATQLERENESLRAELETLRAELTRLRTR